MEPQKLSTSFALCCSFPYDPFQETNHEETDFRLLCNLAACALADAIHRALNTLAEAKPHT